MKPPATANKCMFDHDENEIMTTDDWIFCLRQFIMIIQHTNTHNSHDYSVEQKKFKTIRFLNKALLKSRTTSVIHQRFNFHLKTKVL